MQALHSNEVEMGSEHVGSGLSSMRGTIYIH